MPQLKVNREEVLAARDRLGDAVVRTPLIEVVIGGNRLWLKVEANQTGGAFKLRGATNRLVQLDAAQRSRGVVAFSSGNHAIGVAIAARRLGIDATIVMPSDAPRLKIDKVAAEGATIVFYDRRRESREAIAGALAADRGGTVVPSFDDPHVVAGQGTVGLEIVEQLGRAPSRIVVPCGGGGLAAGIALACPDSAITIVEPEGWDDMGLSLAGGDIVPVADDAPPTLCDALQTPRVSPITFDILVSRRASSLSVTEAEVARAVRWAWDEKSLQIEPGGAVALAAMLAGKVDIDGEVVLVVSGGNIDPALHRRLCNEPGV